MAFNSGFSGGSKVCPLYGGGTAANPANILVMQAAPPAAVANQPGENPIGTIWINVLTGNTYQLVQNTYALGQVWTLLGGAAAAVATINSLTPTGGNIIIAGTANQITATSAVSTITLSLPSALTAPGSVTATTTLTATLGNITATNGNVVLSTIGNGLQIKEGSNARMGQAILNNGTITVSNTSVTANTRIFLSRASNNSSTSLGILQTGAISVGVNFIIEAGTALAPDTPVAGDQSTVNWMLVEAA